MNNLKTCLAVLLALSINACVTEKVESVSDSATLGANDDLISSNALHSTKQAVIDAEKAVENQNFELLAFTNKVINFPGIDMNLYPLDDLQQQCGVKYLSGSGDTLEIGESTEGRKALKNYATTYNLIVLKGCQTFHKNNQK